MLHKFKFILFAIVAISINTTKGQGGFDIELEKFEPFTMTDKEYFDPGTLRLSRKKKNVFVISGNCTFFKNMGEEVMVKLEIFQKDKDDKWTKALESESNICKMMEDQDEFYQSMTEYSNLPYPGKCPFPKDDYYFKDFQVDGNKHDGSVPPGEAMVKTTFSADGQELFGYKIFANVK